MGTGIAICGNIFIDHVKTVDTFPEEGMHANIRAQDHCVGGDDTWGGIAHEPYRMRAGKTYRFQFYMKAL